MQYCSRCVYPASAAAAIVFDDEGVCSGCRTHEEQESIDWDQREALFRELCDDYRSPDGSNYDCLIPVSGGKDSFYQIHLLTKVFGMNPLLVTYGENNHTDVGMRNIQRMREVFGCDHYHFTPSIDVLKRFNRAAFEMIGDPDMHAHMGINAVPIQMAVKFNVPLIIWGEHGFMNMGGMHSYKDMVEYTAKYRKEHNLRGYDWYDFVGKEGLEEKDLLWAKYPDDDDIERLDVRGIFISNFFGWNQAEHAGKMPADISGGMKKRAGLARAIVLDPEIVLYDEPTSGLDPVMASRINHLIIDVKEKLGMTSVVVTHDMDSAYTIADRIAMLYEGRIVQVGTPDEIRNSADPVVRQFVEGRIDGPMM